MRSTVTLATTVAVLLLATPVAIEAQQAPKTYRIAILANEPSFAIEGLRHGLRDLGYLEGRDIAFDYAWAGPRSERFPALAADVVRRKADVIITWGTPAALAAKKATATIPIVMGAIGDPVTVGVVTSLARPGGNITGLSSLAVELDTKRLELLKQLVPEMSRVAVLWHSDNPAQSVSSKTARGRAEVEREALVRLRHRGAYVGRRTGPGEPPGPGWASRVG